jgi:hypothetical protein
MTVSREEERFWDIRTLDRRVRKGLTTRKDIEKHLKGLPDVVDKIAPPEADADGDGVEDAD